LSVSGGADAEGTGYPVGDGGGCDNEKDAAVEGSGWEYASRGRMTDVDGFGFAVDVDGDPSDDGPPKGDAAALGDKGSVTDQAGVGDELGWTAE
jgi:hypothetical protein